MASTALILVVDDSPIQRKLYTGTLKANGYEVIVAENGLQGIKMALQYRPALILMDVVMPEMDGLSAVRELRQYPDMAHVPIVAVTAFTDPADLEEAFQAGYTEVVDKNSDRTALLETINQLLFN